MEDSGERRRSNPSSKTSKKGVKAKKQALNAEEEARRREVVKEALRDKLELERRAVQVVERLLDEDSVTEDFLIDCAKFISADNYKDAIEERSIIKLCGYPICHNKLGKIPTQQFKISTKTNKVYDISERKCFCSNFCYKASKAFELQIPKTPLWLRHHDSPPRITLMEKGDGGSSGEEVRLSAVCLREADIETPSPLEHQAPAAGPVHSDSSDEEQEQDFVSSVVSQRKGPRVHWGELPKRTDEGEQRELGKWARQENVEGEKDKEETQHRGRATLNKNVTKQNSKECIASKTEPGADMARHKQLNTTIGVDEPTVQKVVCEERGPLDLDSVEEGVAKLNLSSKTEATTNSAPPDRDPALKQGKPQDGHTTAVVPSTENRINLEPSASPQPLPATQGDTSSTAQPGLDITQVGMSQRGAAGLRNLLKHHSARAAGPDTFRRNLLEGLKRTLLEWRTEETLTFLYGSVPHPAPPPPVDSGEGKEEKGEEDLDEDDLEDAEEAVVEADGGVEARLPAGQQQERPWAPVPDYDGLRKQTQEMQLRVTEFYKGTWTQPEENKQPAENTQQNSNEPVLPLVDSNAQHLIQKRITMEKLTRSLINVVGPMSLTIYDIKRDLNNLVRTFRFTSTNIIHKPPEWTLIALVLLHLLSEVSPMVREALERPASVEYLNALMQELNLQQQDLLTLVQQIKTSAL